VIPFALVSMRDGIAATGRMALREAQIDRIVETIARSGLATRRIVVVGSALPFVQDAYRLGGHIVAQVLPASADVLAKRPVAAQDDVMRRLFAGKADVAWLTHADETFRIVPIAPP
jgi:hypothetical protein